MLLAVSFTTNVPAETLSITVGELSSALEQHQNEPDALQRAVLDRIQARFDERDIGIDQGDLIYQETLTNKTVEGGCNRTVVLNMETKVTVLGDTRFGLELDSLYEPISVSIHLHALLSATGRARQIIGFRLGECQDVARDSFDFSATGPVGISLSLSLNLNPQFIDETTLRINPSLTIFSNLNQWNIQSDVDDSVFRGLLERLLQAEIEDTLGPQQINAELSALQSKVDEWLQDAVPDGFIDIELPEPNDKQIIALYELLQRDASFPLTLEYVRRHRYELLAALLIGDTDSFANVATDALACQAADVLQIPLTHEPIYIQSSNTCTQAQFNTDSETVYEDSACLHELSVVTTDLNDFCDVALSSERLGNAALDESSLGLWTLSPGNTFDIGSLSITNMLQPWMQRISYKSIFTDRGECRLEMRIYTSHPNASGRTPVIALHGGSWQHRGSGFLGIETTATQFVNQGFIVFAPFYRLIGTNDGNRECNDANIMDALSDTNDALDWVLSNAEQYGSVGKPIVFGQSAGGHLAASLAINRADDVSRAILFYAPSDFHDFAEQIQQGQYTGTQGQRILEAVTGQPVQSLNLDSTLISSNSFPQIIATQPEAYPPMFLLHGQSDSLLPSRQSVRLCNSMSGDPSSGPATLSTEASTYRNVVTCDDKGSELHLIKEGKHALDLCIAPELCFAGSPESRRKTEASIQRMLQWAATDSLPLRSKAQTSSTGGLGALFLLFLLTMLANREVNRDTQKI